jgi:hypothetical protein
MALILIEENNTYKRILIENSYINIDGVYAYSIVYKDKDERDKEKLRYSALQNFIKNFEEKVESINSEDESSPELKLEISLADRIFSMLDRIIYRVENVENYFVPIREEELIEAEKLGFKRE